MFLSLITTTFNSCSITLPYIFATLNLLKSRENCGIIKEGENVVPCLGCPVWDCQPGIEIDKKNNKNFFIDFKNRIEKMKHGNMD